MLFLLALGLVLLLFLLATALRELPFGMPLVGSNSMALSGACHLPRGCEVEDMVLRPLNWGAIADGVADAVADGKSKAGDGDLGFRHDYAQGFEVGTVFENADADTDADADSDGRKIGHCCFSDRVLDIPQVGRLYA
jgi:hypothetical protein